VWVSGRDETARDRSLSGQRCLTNLEPPAVSCDQFLRPEWWDTGDDEIRSQPETHPLGIDSIVSRSNFFDSGSTDECRTRATILCEHHAVGLVAAYTGFKMDCDAEILRQPRFERCPVVCEVKILREVLAVDCNG